MSNVVINYNDSNAQGVAVSATTPLPVTGGSSGISTTDIPRTNTANQNAIAFDGSVQSSAVNAATTEVIVTLEQDGYILIGANPTATTANGQYLVAYQPSPPMKVTGGASKVACIKKTTAGNMNIAEFNRT